MCNHDICQHIVNVSAEIIIHFSCDHVIFNGNSLVHNVISQMYIKCIAQIAVNFSINSFCCKTISSVCSPEPSVVLCVHYQ